MAVCQNLVPLVNIKIAGKWMFIPLKMVLIGIDPSPYGVINYGNKPEQELLWSIQVLTLQPADIEDPNHPCRIIRIPGGVAVKNCSIVHRLSFDSSWFTKIFRSLNLNSSSMFIIYADKTLSHPKKISIENVGYGDKSWEFEHCGFVSK